jgi:outer membrane protein assembly factor BamB
MTNPHLPAERGESLPAFDPLAARPLIARGLARLDQPPAKARELWHFATGNWVNSSPAVADGVVYIGSGDHNVYALDSIP